MTKQSPGPEESSNQRSKTRKKAAMASQAAEGEPPDQQQTKNTAWNNNMPKSSLRKGGTRCGHQKKEQKTNSDNMRAAETETENKNNSNGEGPKKETIRGNSVSEVVNAPICFQR